MKLRLLDVSDRELRGAGADRQTPEFMTLRSPVTGTVLEKNVLEHEYITPQRDLYVVADLSKVWVQAKVYEYELPHIELGQPATVTVASLPGRRFSGKVVFIQPTVEEATRTIQVRVELPNPDGWLKPGMFADIVIAHDMGEGLLVPYVGRHPHGRARHRLSGRAEQPVCPGRSRDRRGEVRRPLSNPQGAEGRRSRRHLGQLPDRLGEPVGAGGGGSQACPAWTWAV